MLSITYVACHCKERGEEKGGGDGGDGGDEHKKGGMVDMKKRERGIREGYVRDT